MADMVLLLDKFVQIYNRNKKIPLLGFEPEALMAMQRYQWPGNVRELENLTQHMSVLHGGRKVTQADLPEKFHSANGAPLPVEPSPDMLAISDQETVWQNGSVDFNSLTDDFERRLILKALALSNGNKKKAAKLLNLKRTTLLEKIKKKDINFSSTAL
jgi:DNA-binding NtrC family response regulator